MNRWMIGGVAVVVTAAVAGMLFSSHRSEPQKTTVAAPTFAAQPSAAQPPAPLPVRQTAAQPAASQAPAHPAPAPAPFGFRRVEINTAGNVPEACFRFSEALDPRAEAHHADYVRIEPHATPAVRTATTDLCLAGLAYGTKYTVTLLHGILAQSGARLDKDETIDLELGDRPPLVAISGEGFILPRAASNGLAIQTVNVDSVKIRVLRMSDRLLPSKLRGEGGCCEAAVLSGERMTRYQLRTLLKDQASLIWSGTMRIEPDHNRTVETAFPLSDIVKPGQTGAYLVIAENALRATPDSFFSPKSIESEDYSDELFQEIPAHWVIATDIALTTMSGPDGLHVFARSLASAEPMAGLKLSLLAVGQDVLADAVTDERGRADFAPGLLRGHGASAARTIVAYGAAGDFAVSDLDRPAFDLSDRGVSGRAMPGPIEAFLFTERGIYRPGETVEVMALLRDRLGKAVETLPLTLVLRRPDGVEAKRFALPPAAAGGADQSVALTRSAARGIWSVEALIDPSGGAIGRVQFDVQDFVPQQLKVTATAARPVLRPGEPMDVEVEGQFLYGAPAAGLKGEAELRITRDPAPVAEAKGYSFGLVDEKVDDQTQPLEMPDADESGHAHIAAVLQLPKPTSAPLKGMLSAGFFEPSGRIVKDQLELPIRSQPLLIGIKPRFAEGRVEENQDAIFDLRVFDETGRPIARPGLQWEIVREDHVFDWLSTGARNWTWHYHVVDRPFASGAIDVGEAAPTALSQRVDWGWYRLVLRDPATNAASSVRFEAGWAATAEAAETPDKVEVTVEKPALAPGQATQLHIKGPFAGKAMVAVAGDRIFETRELAIPKNGATVEVAASADWGAGAYVLVSMYRPLTGGDRHDPVRAVGLAWLAIDASPRSLGVAIAAPEKVTPRQPVEFGLKVAGAAGHRAFVTLAAVDEGILQLTRFATPDPVAFLFGKRRLAFDVRDDYGRLLDGSADPGVIREGGDEGIGGAGLPVTSTHIVSLFAGPVALDAEGNAKIRLAVPDFEGQLRLMAVAYDDDGVGSGEGKLTVRDPVIANLALPRFLAPGDRARLAVDLHNTDGTAGTYHVTVAAQGAARIAEHPIAIALDAGQRKTEALEIEGRDEGVASVTLDLTGPGDYHVARNWQIAVRGPHRPITLAETALQKPGQEFRLDAAKLRPFLPGSVSVTVDYANFAGIDVPALLQSLWRYPYGCTEQLSSSAFPLLYVNDKSLLGNLPGDTGVKERVQQAIDTILDRQDAAGAFGLWRAGDGEASAWLNVYAVDFLEHAKDAGFAVPEGALQRAHSWLMLALRQIDSANEGYYAHAPDATRAYAWYVLARSRRADIGELRRLHDNVGLEMSGDRIVPASVNWRQNGGRDTLASALSLGHLAGALSLMGDRARAQHAMALAIANLDIADPPLWWRYYAYYSGWRDLAGLIAVAAEIGDRQIAATLIERLKNLGPDPERLNTQDKAWLLAAAHALSRNESARALAINGEAPPELALPAALAPAAAEIERGWRVANRGQVELWRTVVVRGVPKEAPSAIAEGLSLDKEFLTLTGQPLDPAHLRQNDRLIVSLSGEAENDQGHRAILVDMLPAGWEIEAPVTAPEQYAFLGPLSRPRAIEARDDRFVAAFDLGEIAEDGGRRRFHVQESNDEKNELESRAFHVAYVVRVVTPGSFVLPEAVVEDMYRPEVMARTAAGRTVADPR
jgi:alpha-2-macroglobulin